MQPLDRIENKIDGLQRDMNSIISDTNTRLAKLETTQKGMVALCIAIVTAALGTLAKALNL